MWRENTCIMPDSTQWLRLAGMTLCRLMPVISQTRFVPGSYPEKCQLQNRLNVALVPSGHLNSSAYKKERKAAFHIYLQTVHISLNKT